MTKQSLIGTFSFLFILLLIGFIGGYSLRGSAYASPGQGAGISLAMAAVAPPEGLDVGGGRSRLVASLGSGAPDELIALHASTHGEVSALIRLHAIGEDESDKLSLIEIGPSGATKEVMRLDASGLRSVDLERTADGKYISASLLPDTLEIRGLGPDGTTEWLRESKVAAAGNANVEMITMAKGSVIVGPSESPERQGITYLDPAGGLLWQRTMRADGGVADIQLTPGEQGSFFLAMRTSSNASGNVHSLTHVDREGQDQWRTEIQLAIGERLGGMAPAGDGGVYALTTGNSPTLHMFDRSGIELWAVPMPQAKFYNSIHLISNERGNAVVAVSYAIANERLDVWFEERSAAGDLVNETSLTLPGSSFVDAITVSSANHYLIAGSVLPSRFEDADIFIKDVEFQTGSGFMAANAGDLSSDGVLDAPLADTMTALTSEIEGDIGANLAIASVAGGLLEGAEVAEASLEPVGRASMAPIALTDATEQSLTAELAPPEIDDGVALSRFVKTPVAFSASENLISDGDLVRAQCRFSCLEKDSASARFPIWRAIEAPQTAFNAGLPSAHELTCRSAGGQVDLLSKPDCQPS